MKRSFLHISYFLLSYFLFLIPYFSTAQWYDPEKTNKKANILCENALNDAQNEKYNDALKKLDQALSIDPRSVDAYLLKAGIYGQIKKYDSSVINYQKSIELDSVYTHVSQLSYSISLAGAGKFKDALKAADKFLTIPNLNQQSIKAAQYRRSVYEFAIDYDNKHPLGNYVFAPINLGDSINTIESEYYPSLTIDRKRMVFNRRTRGDEDFYETRLIDGKWGNATPLEGRVNTNLNEGAQNISQDGNWIVFTGCSYPEGYGSCDIYISYKTKNGWTEAENLGGWVNTDFWESSPSLSPDKKDLYFISGMPGGYGGKDVWVSHRSLNGKWGRPENLGPTINTAADEACSFMYADNQTLFFNSTGHPGYGMGDLFFSKKINDSTWSEPQNLGYPINTIDEEGSLIIASDGKTAYYASDKSDTKGGLDLYSFELREDIRPPRTLWVQGKVFDAKTKIGLPSSVELTDINSGISVAKVQTDEEGNYLATLPVGKDYAFNVTRKGYLFYSENYDLNNYTSDTPFTADIPLLPIEAGALVVLKNIFFDTKKTELKPQSLTELNKVIQLMNDNPKLKILISGHTDNVGKDADNLKLSNDRALSVINYLLASRQIPKERLQYKGFGATKPVADNKTEEGRAMNRRTELSVISN